MKVRRQAGVTVVCFLLGMVGSAGCGNGDGSVTEKTKSLPPVSVVPDAPGVEVPNSALPSNRKPPDTIRLKTRLAPALPIGMPTDIALYGRYVLLADQYLSPHLSVTNQHTGNLVARFGKDGEGPGEFRSPVSLDVLPGQLPKAWIYDARERRMSLFALDPPHAPKLQEILRLDAAPQLLDPHRLGTGFVANGLFLKSSLMMFGEQGEPAERIRGALPFDEAKEPVPVARVQRNLSHLAVRPNRKRFALAYQHKDRLDIYDASGRRLHTTRGPREIETEFVKGPGGSAFRPS